MDKIRIVFVVNNLVIGGVSQVLIQLCNALEKDKYDIHLISLSNDLAMEKIIPLKKHIEKHCIKYPFIKSYSLLSYLKAAMFPHLTKKRAREVLLLIDRLSPDIMHFHTLPRQLIIGQLAQKTNRNVELVFTDHGVRISKEDAYRYYQKKMLIYAFRHFYKRFHLVAVSKTVRQFLVDHQLLSTHTKLYLLENSIPIERYKRTIKITELEPQFIFVSRLNEQKGHDTLIAAWKKIQTRDKGKLIIVGPDEMNGKFQRMAEGDPSIEFTGSVSNVETYLNQSTVAVFPSQKEGLPISLLEKMAMELPVIVSDISELTSIVEDGIEGVHFELDNTDDLYSKLLYAIDNPEKMNAMGKSALKKVEKICQENDVLEFHNHLYQSLMNKI